MYTTGTKPLRALLSLQQLDAPWERSLLPRRMLSNAKGELPCWYPFATEQFRLGLPYDFNPQVSSRRVSRNLWLIKSLLLRDAIPGWETVHHRQLGECPRLRLFHIILWGPAIRLVP